MHPLYSLRHIVGRRQAAVSLYSTRLRFLIVGSTRLRFLIGGSTTTRLRFVISGSTRLRVGLGTCSCWYRPYNPHHLTTTELGSEAEAEVASDCRRRRRRWRRRPVCCAVLCAVLGGPAVPEKVQRRSLVERAAAAAAAASVCDALRGRTYAAREGVSSRNRHGCL